MSGYNKHSMSNNARNAYDAGEMPISKWTKKAIIDVAEEYEVDEEKIKLMRKIPVGILKNTALKCTSWHHTSSHFNETDFYGLNLQWINNLDQETVDWLLERDKQEKQEKREVQKERKALCKFLIWSGSRKYPSVKEEQAEGVIKGNWFYYEDGKKKIDAKGFEILKWLD